MLESDLTDNNCSSSNSKMEAFFGFLEIIQFFTGYLLNGFIFSIGVHYFHLDGFFLTLSLVAPLILICSLLLNFLRNILFEVFFFLGSVVTNRKFGGTTILSNLNVVGFQVRQFLKSLNHSEYVLAVGSNHSIQVIVIILIFN